MAVVINEFEVVPQAPAPPPPQQGANGSASTPADMAKEIEKAMQKRAERAHRLSTY